MWEVFVRWDVWMSVWYCATATNYVNWIITNNKNATVDGSLVHMKIVTVQQLVDSWSDNSNFVATL